MNVCVQCKKEMVCHKNGVNVRFGNGEHCYIGDSFKCPECGNEIVVTNPVPYYDQGLKRQTDTDIWMNDQC